MLQTAEFKKVVSGLKKVLKMTGREFGVAQPLFEGIGTMSLTK